MRVRIRFTAATALAGLACGLLGASSAAAASPDERYGKDAWWYKAMGIADAHKISTGKGVTVAVIDEALDPTVPELRGQDVTPVGNFCAGGPTRTGAGASHGTSISVNIVGSGRGTLPGGRGVAGIAPDASLRFYAIDDSPAKDAQCAKTVELAMADAIDAAVADNARIISIASGATKRVAVNEAAVQRALAAGVVVVAASGNSPAVNSVVYPAAFPGVIAVAAVDRNAKPWSGNVAGNREAFVISAPGVDVSTGLFDGDRWRSDAFVTGTSEAAPLVAGGLALVAAKYPKATGNQLIQHLIHNPGGEGAFGRDLEYGYGIISVPKMLVSDPAQWPDVNPLVPAVAGAPAPAAGAATAEPVAPGSVPVATEAAEDDGGSSMGLLLGGGLAVVLLIGGLVFALSRRRSGTEQAPTGGWGGGGSG